MCLIWGSFIIPKLLNFNFIYILCWWITIWLVLRIVNKHFSIVHLLLVARYLLIKIFKILVCFILPCLSFGYRIQLLFLFLSIFIYIVVQRIFIANIITLRIWKILFFILIYKDLIEYFILLFLYVLWHYFHSIVF
jgi:hypothetical protein